MTSFDKWKYFKRIGLFGRCTALAVMYFSIKFHGRTQFTYVTFIIRLQMQKKCSNFRIVTIAHKSLSLFTRSTYNYRRISFFSHFDFIFLDWYQDFIKITRFINKFINCLNIYSRNYKNKKSMFNTKIFSSILFLTLEFNQNKNNYFDWFIFFKNYLNKQYIF